MEYAALEEGEEWGLHGSHCLDEGAGEALLSPDPHMASPEARIQAKVPHVGRAT